MILKAIKNFVAHGAFIPVGTIFDVDTTTGNGLVADGLAQADAGPAVLVIKLNLHGLPTSLRPTPSDTSEQIITRLETLVNEKQDVGALPSPVVLKKTPGF